MIYHKICNVAKLNEIGQGMIVINSQYQPFKTVGFKFRSMRLGTDTSAIIFLLLFFYFLNLKFELGTKLDEQIVNKCFLSN